MPEHCTCGTLLVEGASFCHRCGRPTRPEPEVEAVQDRVQLQSEIPAPQATRRPDLSALPIGFRNPIAVRVAFVMSLGIMFLEMVPGVNFLFLLWWLAAGWVGVNVYRRMTGVTLNIRAGAKLGTLTGILTFLSMAILLAVSMAFSGKEIFAEMVKQKPEIAPLLDQPFELGAAMLVVLAIIFTMVVGVCTAGGALGARFSARSQSSLTGMSK